jgi:hypothetical protein
VGLARFSHLQVAMDNAFNSPILNIPYATEQCYVLSNTLPNSTYYWRVRTIADDGSAGGWSTNVFMTVPPGIAVTTPNGGELWQRGLDYFISWEDNIAEDVSIALYKSGGFVEFITTNTPSSGAFKWEPGFHLSPGNDYSVRIASTTDGLLTDESDLEFNLDVPRITDIHQEIDGSVVLQWAGTSAGVYVEFSTAPAGQPWLELAGPLFTSIWTDLAPSSSMVGHYRLRLE